MNEWLLRWNPCYHCLVLEGGVDETGKFVHIPVGDFRGASEYFPQVVILTALSGVAVSVLGTPLNAAPLLAVPCAVLLAWARPLPAYPHWGATGTPRGLYPGAGIVVSCGISYNSGTVDPSVCRRIVENISQVVVGKSQAVELLLVALLAEGHVLIEDVPGVAKTLLAKSLARSVGGSFTRVQFTPDLMPADITGFSVYDQKAGSFSFRPGPVMTHVLLADEINRTIPRTQSSLLECMEERQVTVDGTTHRLPRPFFVLATQNPIELEGTFPLPEAQLDRFLLKARIGYPDRGEEIRILQRFRSEDPLEALIAVAQPQDIIELQQARREVRVSLPVMGYIADLVQATRDHEALRYGASPRGSLALMRSAQALAMLRGREYVLPDDVKALVPAVFSHRLILEDAGRLRGEEAEQLLAEIVDRVPVPAPAG
jgi:MoxR-like ATPase